MGRIKYLLDSNILSEPARLQSEAKVLQAFADHDGEYATAGIVWHELKYGCELLPESKRKIQLTAYLDLFIANGLTVLPFFHANADWYAKERVRLQTLGKPLLMQMAKSQRLRRAKV